MPWTTGAAAGSGRLFKDSEELSSQEQHLALVEGLAANCSEQELRSQLSEFAQVAWCNSAGPGRFLVRFVSHEGLAAAARAMDGSCLLGSTIRISPYASHTLLPMQQDSNLPPRAESIPAMLPDQLDYLNLLLSEEAAQSEAMQQLESCPPTGISMFQHGLQELDPASYEWNPLHNSGSLFASLDDELLSADDSPMHSFSSSGPSTCQLWTQRSIGATARKDLAKFAALQNLAQQHSNSSTPGPCLAPTGSGLGGIVSPWGSISSAHSSSMEAVAAAAAAAASKLTVDVSMVRRTSSPGGIGPQQQHPAACLTPRSPCGFPSNADAMIAVMQQQQQQQQQQFMAGGGGNPAAAANAWGCPAGFGLQQQLPGELFDGVADESGDLVERFRLQALMAAQQQGGLSQDALPALLSLGLLGGLSAAAGAPQQQAGMGGLAGGLGSVDHLVSHSLDSVDMHGILGLAGAVPPPPPPAQQQQQQHAGLGGGGVPPPPPPPPPGGNRMNGASPQQQTQQQQQAAGGGAMAAPDGRRAGAASPVHAGVPAPPPPRAMTPGAGAPVGNSTGIWSSPCVSPRYSGPSQSSSPNPGFRGPRQGSRALPGMSNLAHCTSGGPNTVVLPAQSAYDASCNNNNNSSSQQQQQQPPQPPYPRIGSPLQRGLPGGVPPPPPPPPGYAAAAAAAAAACGSGGCSPIVPPLPPLGPFLSGPVMPGPPGSPASARGPGSVCSPRPPPLDSMGSSNARPTALLPPWQQQQQGGGGGGGSQAAVAAAAAAAALAAISGGPSAGAPAAAATPGQGAPARPPAGSGAAAAGAAAGAASEVRVLRADGALFVRELLQLLKAGSEAGNLFLANLRDLLDCALSSTSSEQQADELQQPAAAAVAEAGQEAKNSSSSGGNGSGGGSRRRSSAAGNSSKGAAAPAGAATVGQGGSKEAAVDAAAFLGMLQEAAAPLMAAAALASQQQQGRSSGGGNSSNNTSSSGSSAGSSQASRRGSGRSSDASEAAAAGMSGSSAGIKQGDGGRGKGLRALRTERCSSAAGEGSSSSSSGAAVQAGGDLGDSLPQQLLLRHQLSRGGSTSASGGQLFYPLHPRTTTHGCRDAGSSSSCGGAAPGTPHGTPMLLVPQTVPELLSARAALMRLMISAHSFVTSTAGYARMSERLGGIEELYDSMHDDPVVVKRRKCRDMAAMRDAIKHEPEFAQAVSSLSSLRNHIYSLSRKVLIGYGHVEGLPIDLLLGGLTSELAAILAEPSAPLPATMLQRTQQQQQQGGGVSGSGDASSDGGSAAAAADAAAVGGSGCLPQQVLDFYTSVLPLPKLALLVFTEFVAVDPAPSCMAIPSATVPADGAAAAGDGGASAANMAAGSQPGNGGSSSGSGNNSNAGAGSSMLGRPSSLRDRRSSGSSHDSNSNSSGGEGGSSRHGRSGNGNSRLSSREGDAEQQQGGEQHSPPGGQA